MGAGDAKGRCSRYCKTLVFKENVHPNPGAAMGIDQEENSGRGKVVAEVRATVPLSDLVSSLVELITSQVEQGSIQDGRRSLESN
ncbi:hypothetical protein Godav_015016 [Gossypium davidsonii]|uniref:Uncharacterized protein n=2 Tax=Gossypium TaxID=3633 RepID=A0A7J8RMK8_GOSDV|nr:hypothetical protein [Gossypium davidsonii]MBA0649983.1 hypothetical protein [Gossypium klotzschianum]